MQHSNALPALTVVHRRQLLRTSSKPQYVNQLADVTLLSLSRPSNACTQDTEDAAITSYRTAEDRILDWESAEQRLTSACFLMWAVGVTLLGWWHVANHF